MCHKVHNMLEVEMMKCKDCNVPSHDDETINVQR